MYLPSLPQKVLENILVYFILLTPEWQKFRRKIISQEGKQWGVEIKPLKNDT